MQPLSAGADRQGGGGHAFQSDNKGAERGGLGGSRREIHFQGDR